MCNVAHIITVFLSIVFFLTAILGVLGSRVLFKGESFALMVLVLSAYTGGVLVKLLKFPPLIGMLTVGILFRNIPLPFDTHISKEVSSALRTLSLVIILLKAGLGLDSNTLRTIKWVIMRLSLIPCLLEAVATAVLSHFLLGFPWNWAFMLGFILTAVSAAILVPGAISLEKRELGTQHGIPTLLLASVSVDNVAAITGFYIIFNILKTGGSSSWILLLHLSEPLIGFLVGAVLGVVMWYFPDKRSNEYSITYYHVLLLILMGITVVFLSKRFGMPAMGAMSCVILAFVASLEWGKNTEQFNRIKWITGILWLFIEPFLFGLIGAEITVRNLQNDLGYSILLLSIGAFVRVLSTILSLLGSPLDFQERIFVAFSWISKATVQAAVGSEAMDYATMGNEGQEFVELGERVLTLSVLVILITAPLGAMLMSILGNYLLKKSILLPEVRRENQPPNLVNNQGTNYGACNQEKAPY